MQLYAKSALCKLIIVLDLEINKMSQIHSNSSGYFTKFKALQESVEMLGECLVDTILWRSLSQSHCKGKLCKARKNNIENLNPMNLLILAC